MIRAVVRGIFWLGVVALVVAAVGALEGKASFAAPLALVAAVILSLLVIGMAGRAHRG